MTRFSLLLAAFLLLFPAHGAQDVFPASLEAIEYPVLAIQARISGTVEVELAIAADGTVDEVRRISGHILLVRALEEGIKRWRFLPRCLSKQQSARTVLPLKVTFILEGETEYRPRTRFRYVYPDRVFITAENLHWQPLGQGHSPDAARDE